MLKLVGVLAKTHARWSAELHRSLVSAALGRSAGERFSSDASFDRVAARYFLVALAPVLLLALSDGLHWRRGALFYGWVVITCAWAAFVFALLFRTGFGAAREVLRQAAERHRRKGR